MKKALILAAMILGTCITWLPARASLTQAESFYRAGQYAQALAAYEQELKNYPNSPYLYYNIGNCYFKMGNKGLAVANYYRAFKLQPRDEDIRHNLELSLAASGESFVPAGIPSAVHRAFFALSETELKGVVCAIAWLVCLLAGICLLTRKAGKLTLLAAVILLGCAAWFYMLHTWQIQPLAVVAAPTAELRSGPGLNFPPSASIAQGHLVKVLDKKDNWQQVIVRSQGLKGWVEADTLEHI